jgi:hypothetical protein
MSAARAIHAIDWEARARLWYAIACASLDLDPGPRAPKVPPVVSGDPRRACEWIVQSGAEHMRPRRANPLRVLANAADVRRALFDYRVKHWGHGGKATVKPVSVPDPRGVLVKLGTLREITYETTKAGDPPRTWYTHEFESPFPELAYSQNGGGLVICDGKYRVTARGIVG